MKGLLVVPLCVILSIMGSEGAAIQKANGINSPVYDEVFMRKLCAFLGATYVRSAKDPMCWYTWCHNAEPYHMQCPPGRAVSKHFYWSTEDPCTEHDDQEQCLVGYLKNMHLENKPEEEEFETQEDPAAHVNLPESDEANPGDMGQEENVAQTEDIEERKKGSVPDKPEKYEDDSSDTRPKELVGERQARLTGESEHEPIPELDPKERNEIAQKDVMVKKIENHENKDNVYFPEQHRAHIVDAFVPREPIPLYGGYRRYNGPFHYFPQQFYPAPTHEQQPAQNFQITRANEEEDRQSAFKITTTSEPQYLQPMARSARLMGGRGPMASAQRQHGHFPQDDQYRTAGEYDYQPEYIYDENHIDTSDNKSGPELNAKTKDGEPNRGNEIGEMELIEAVDIMNKKDEPMVYDYFKTHFVEEV